MAKRQAKHRINTDKSPFFKILKLVTPVRNTRGAYSQSWEGAWILTQPRKSLLGGG